MSYIEREELIDYLDYINNELPLITEREWDIAKGYDEVIDEVKKFPTADVQPVVHGEWKQTGGKYSRHKTIDRRILTCSVCGNFLYMEGVNAGRGDANYCPNCGARMDGEA